MSKTGSAEVIAARVLDWQSEHGRHDLPWQIDATPYRVWVSEIMLQQTQVATVIDYFNRFIASMPTLPALADADLDDVLALWSGLGYYSRARNLHRAALQCVEQHNGALPNSLELLTDLPGIGPSTAGAILSLGFGERGVILDGNVKRVLTRYFAISGWPGRSAVAKHLWSLADEATPSKDCRRYNQGMMDLGATVCLPRQPRCDQCPLSGSCHAHREGNPGDYPGRKRKKILPVRRTYMLLIHDEHRVLLQRRPPTGIWGGLWSLPERETLKGLSARRLDSFQHTFTHFKLEIQPAVVEPEAFDEMADTPDQRWTDRNGLQSIGVPTPVRRLLEQYLQAD